jgi:hypothetical protein
LARKASKKAITPAPRPTRCVLWSEAAAFLAAAYRSLQVAEQVLVMGLAQERVRWSCQLLKGSTAGWNLPLSEPAVSGKFWRHNPEIHSAENWARTRFLSGPTVYMIAVAEEDVRALLPAAEQTAPLRARPKRKSQQDPVHVVVEDIWGPAGLPADVSTPAAVQRLGNEMQHRQMRVPHQDTLKRALGRR